VGLETGTYISDLVVTNPTGSDGKDKGDDHLRLLKSTIKATFPNVNGAVNPTPTEFNYLVGVTSLIQNQFGAKGAKAGDTWTGTHNFSGATAVTVPTKSPLDNSTNASSTAYVDAAVTSAAVSGAGTLSSTSTTSLLIANASKSFTTQTGKAYQGGYQFVSMISAANPANYMVGTVTSYTSVTGAMVVNVTQSGGSGTYADWNISVCGAPGAVGTLAATTQQTLTDGATVNWDFSLGRIGAWTIAGNRTLAAPTNLVIDTFILKITQDATGSRLVTWNSIYKFSGGVLPVLSTVAGRVDIFSGYYDGTNIHLNLVSQGSR
jgi:hypothetical protein